jgi:vancomycin resistance protein YoaR
MSRGHRLVRAIVRGLVSLSLLLALLVAGVLAAVLAYNLHHANRIFPGVTIQGVPVGGLFPGEALQRVYTVLDDAVYPYVRLHSAEGEWTINTRDLGATFNVEGAVREAFLLGREGVFRHDIRTRLELLWWGYRVVPEFYIEPGLALAPLRSVAREAGHPTRQAQLRIGGLQATAGTSEAGREMDVEATRGAIEVEVRKVLGRSSWGQLPRLQSIVHLTQAQETDSMWPQPALRTELPRGIEESDAGAVYYATSHSVAASAYVPIEPIEIKVSFREIIPPLTEVDGGRERAAQVLAGPIVAFFDFPEIQPDGSERPLSRRWAIDRTVLSTWLTVVRVSEEAGTPGLHLVVDVDQQLIMQWVRQLASEIDRPPEDQRFHYNPSTGQLTVVAPGRNGYALDIATTTERIAQACFAPNSGEGRSVELAVHVISPQVTYAELEALSPLTLLGEGQSNFVGSTPERLQNIKTASARFHGVAIPADATFSFMTHLGLVTTASGYSDSLIIYGNRTELGPGGGVCQVSTTAFRAAFWSGLPIVERWPHSYRVSWYEPPLGLDAAVFYPVPDLRFHNDTGAPLLILTEVNEARSELFFRFYGRATGRKVTMEGPKVSQPVPPGPPILEEDPTLAAGSRVLVERARDGIDVTLYRIIEQEASEGSPAQRKREAFVSNYKPWPARYRVGTKPQ